MEKEVLIELRGRKDLLKRVYDGHFSRGLTMNKMNGFLKEVQLMINEGALEHEEDKVKMIVKGVSMRISEINAKGS